MRHANVQILLNRARSYGYQQGFRQAAVLYGTEAGLSARALSQRLGITERGVTKIRMRLRKCYEDKNWSCHSEQRWPYAILMESE